jgi:hypothetical protein
MKRLFVIVVCLSILYAGTVSAFAGCDNLIAAATGHDHGDDSGGHQHGGTAAPHHDDAGKIHCPNLFGAFLVASRSSPETERRAAAAVDYPGFQLLYLVHRPASGWFDLRPPGPSVSQLRPLHLLLSVIRI